MNIKRKGNKNSYKRKATKSMKSFFNIGKKEREETKKRSNF